MTEQQIGYLQAKVTDIWYMLDREQNDEKIARLCGKLDGIRLVLDMFDYTIICDESGEHKIVKEDE